MKSYRIFTIRKKNEWDTYIRCALESDVFHSWHYHAQNKEGEPFLFIYEEKDFFIAFPLIRRKIKNSSFYDLTSVYGYCGPVSDRNFSHIPASSRENFKLSFTNFMKEENCICVFARLHPFINQHDLLEGIGGIRDNGSTLYMDLSLSIQEQRMRYNKRLLRDIKRLREKDYLIKEVTAQEEIKNFTEMYYENMDRLHASENYYFNEEYFTNLLMADDFENKLLLIYHGSELICGALLLISENLIRNHLSATSFKYLNESPSKLLTDEISVIGKKLGKKMFHLGGGVSGKEDSLYQFKRYFSDLQIKDRLWCYINDESVYNELVSKRENEVNQESNFFPLYRQIAKKTIVSLTS